MTELAERRSRLCRLTPDRALETLDEAERFLVDRGMLTLMPDCSLPSLFGACHEEPYDASKQGFGQWPRTKFPWGVELAARPGVCALKIHRGKRLFLSAETAAVVDPLCRAELARAEAGEYGPEAARLVAHLAEVGPSLVEELTEELGLDRRARTRLERVGAVVSRGFVLEPHRHTSELARWDQRFEPSAGGGLEELVLAGVRAAVVAPEREVRTWFSWLAPAELLERLPHPEPGWVSVG